MSRPERAADELARCNCQNPHSPFSGLHRVAAEKREAQAASELWRFEEHAGEVTSVTFTPDGTGALRGGNDGTVRLWTWNAVGGEIRGSERRCLRGHWAPVQSVVATPDGRRAISAGFDGIRVWDLSKGKGLH